MNTADNKARKRDTKMTKLQMIKKLNELLEIKHISHLDGITTNSNKNSIQNAIDCLECTDDQMNDYLTVIKLKYPNTYNTISNNGDYLTHTFNRLYVYNTAIRILEIN